MQGTTEGISPSKRPQTWQTAGASTDLLESELTSRVRQRSPAVSVAVCFAAGIAVDRWWGLPWVGWLGAGLIVAAYWWRGSVKRSGVLLLAAWVCLGGARHHLFWSVRRANDVSTFAAEIPQPARLVARIVTQPWIQTREIDTLRSAWPQYDRSGCLLECRWLETNRGRIEVSGTARLSVVGHLLHVRVGDEVEVCGLFSRPRPPGNPGQFDFSDHLRRQGAGCMIYADYPQAVRRLSSRHRPWFRRGIARLREQAEWILVKQLSPQSVPVASALLLGSRSAITDDIRTVFAESGMMHLLAISGLHVGILAGFLWVCCRILNLSVAATAAVILMGVAGYAFITDCRPSVVRAAVLCFVAFAGRPWHRQPVMANTLAISALIVLFWNPSNLFGTGAQLSFLTVTAIVWSDAWLRESRRDPSQLDIVSLTRQTGWFRRRFDMFAEWLKHGYWIMFAIGLFTVPLVAARYNLISPVGFVINVFLIPLVALVLWTGYGLLFCGFLIPQVAPVFGIGFDLGLRFLLWIVEIAAQLRLGHLYVPAPSTWWLVGYYLLLGGAVCFWRRKWIKGWVWIGLCAWTVLGLSTALLPAQRTGLRCSFLAVGHGCAVLIELPNGKTVLYDAGSLQDGDRAQQIVQGALWERGLSHLDAVILSHADIDHFNAVPGLLRAVPLGSVLVAGSFLDVEQEGVVELCSAAMANGVPIQLIRQGDRLLLDPAVTLHVLHPPADAVSSRDNANSVVLLVEFAGRRIVLCGDLAGDGLDRLLRRPREDVDVMLSPHHGSLNANRPKLADWAKPNWVVVSGGRRRLLPSLRENYGSGTKILSTIERGAITFDIEPNGVIQRTCHRRRPDPEDSSQPVAVSQWQTTPPIR